MKKLYLLFFAISSFWACSSNSAPSNETENQMATASAIPEEASIVKVDDDIINDILQSIPSPLEISLLIKEVGSYYNKADLNDHNKVSSYSTNFDKALNLGIYGTDLGYSNIYNKNQDALNYLNSVQNLAEGLTIGQFFDYATLKSLAESADQNLDALLRTTTANFEKINYHLRQQKREHLSILLLTGGWVEALYLTTLVHQRTNNEVLREKIGEQKIVLDRILLVLEVYKTRNGFAELIADLKKLQAIYDQIEIETVYEEPTMVEKDGVLVVVDNTKSVVNITDRDIDTITSLTKSIRNKIIN
ncbi:MAG: hypothetical protein CMO01_22615 [Thalassobius sp.]|nr:hypothetical protein [Thalassovita sp.]|tara:strand:+ start:9 stop:920 length:912 start_codon:yes stop_codon:yes gene_type:complete